MAATKKNSKQFNPDGEIRDQGLAVHEGKTPAASVQLEPLEERVLFSADFIGLNPANGLRIPVLMTHRMQPACLM